MSQLTETSPSIDMKNNLRMLKDKLGGLSSAEIAGKKIIRVAVKIDSNILPLDWLKTTVSESKIFWTDRTNNFEMAGIGVCLLFDSEEYDQTGTTIESALEILRECDEDVRFYGGIRFPANGTNSQESDWDEFKSSRFLIPRFELVRNDEQLQLVCNIKAEELDNFLKVENEIDSIVISLSGIDSNHSEIINRQDEPNFDIWAGNIKSIVEDFSDGKLEKIVLARQSSFQFRENCDSLSLLNRLSSSTPHCYHYFFQPKNGLAFLGASPEQLYLRRGRQIASEALAGTRPRGEDAKEDLKLGDELLHNEKELLEHNYVVENIKTALSELCENYSAHNGTELLKLNRVQHLRTRFNGILKSKIGDAKIINELHPTSAVGGYPSKNARERIAECEQFDRGWYAGVVGWLSKDSAEFAVAIRSGLVRDNVLKLYSGAGIVRGSTPESEWAEIESKIGSFLSAVTG